MHILYTYLKTHGKIHGLDMRYNDITDQGARHLAGLLQENVAVQSLDLMCNNIEAEGAEHVAKSLHLNKTLMSLRLTGNKIGDKGAMHFASMLQINTKLEELDFSDCDLGTQSLIAFSIVLNSNKHIRSINLSRPLLYSHQEEPTIHIARMLVVNQTLCELHLGKHEMTDTGVERLCEALQVNKSLRYLDLRCNKITRDGAKFLAEVLKQGSPLEILDLSANRIEDDGAMHLSEAILLPNCKLKALSIPCNNIGTLGLVAFTKAMKINKSLTHIYIWGNKLEEPVCVAFTKLMRSGRLLELHTDVSPYMVDGHVCLAEVFHGLRRHFYWTPSYGEDGEYASNSALALSDTSDDFLPHDIFGHS
ncbi:leucine-rich repeat-containing protein 34 isoform X2 [Clupea harengus]|uniref:Leucine-rich repeat-containing protein 34 isoform X2 n=1 Tax=Clupea harengus TaxID=7950 RepID=A0A6P8GKF3_CLUHA|nr:leucine-rich repeat-containing protein 34 isoform X2 [Clupea harengus]